VPPLAFFRLGREEKMEEMGQGMGQGMHFWNLAVFAIAIFLLLFPIARILRRAGHSGWWSIVFVLPILNFIGLWVFAYVRWPNLPDEPA
jgi:predicted PurR-regulated permease PerM